MALWWPTDLNSLAYEHVKNHLKWISHKECSESNYRRHVETGINSLYALITDEVKKEAEKQGIDNPDFPLTDDEWNTLSIACFNAGETLKTECGGKYHLLLE
tara:strand:+ start:298 stop:603 length:306 start_codon:yes stop_codon:yes gene_type:complete